jgi:hypothetical protein
MCTGDCRRLPARIVFAAFVATMCWCGSFQNAFTQVTNHGGPTLQNPVRVFLIFWAPPGVVFDTSAADGVGNFKSLFQRFIGDLSGSSYANILTQYPGACGQNQCVITNGAGAFVLGGSWTDSQDYPGGRGTHDNPLQDSDIRSEVTRAIAQNFWTVDNNAVFFVVTGVFTSTGALVEECSGWSCTFNLFCAYHDYFSSAGNNIRYGYISDGGAREDRGCDFGVATNFRATYDEAAINGQVSSDRAVAALSHELFETITDPEFSGWYDDHLLGGEIGDLCSQIPAIVVMNGNSYNVQQQWSRANSPICVSSFGPTVKLTVETGSDDLRGDSSVVAGLQDPGGGASYQIATIKTQDDAGWNTNTSHIAIIPYNQVLTSSLARVTLTLQGNENWNIDGLLIELLDPAGSTLCSQRLNGSPLAQLNRSVPTVTFDTPNCQPQPTQESVLCYVFNDGYTDMSDTTDAIFINSSHQACMPGGPTRTGICRKWAGRCITSPGGKPVTMNVFDDGGGNNAGSADAVFVNGDDHACIPDGTASGTCRRWFGQGQTSDGHDVMCTVFDDAYTDQSLLSGAVYVNRNQKSCIPDGTPQGTCAKWWGRCVVQ